MADVYQQYVTLEIKLRIVGDAVGETVGDTVGVVDTARVARDSLPR